MISIGIDPRSGFCGGVIRAIGIAEQYLKDSGGKLYSLGAIVHNEEELARLQALGLVTIDREDLERMSEADREGEALLIRAHGEAPRIYARARSLGFKIIDCTCPVVLKLQQDIRKASARLQPKGGEVVIFGKIGHPEVLGLLGQVGGNAIVVEDLTQLKAMIGTGKLRIDRDIELFSQTTMSPSDYMLLRSYLASLMRGATLTVHDTICSQVASRFRDLSAFAAAHDVIVFVSGKTSSNGKVLSELCRSINARIHIVGSIDELSADWFSRGETVGVCGATSTPKWLLEKVAETIAKIAVNC